MDGTSASKLILGDVLGEGGMGTVYHGELSGPGSFRRQVAVKKLSIGNQDDAIREASLLASLAHPNIVSVLDVRTQGSELLIVMELLKGFTLQKILDECAVRNLQLPSAVITGVLDQVSKGLAFAHRSGVIHRDISPHNIFLTTEGEIKIIDFGLSRRSTDEASKQLYGKLTFLAPERKQGASATPESDLYSLGITLWKCVTCGTPAYFEDIPTSTEDAQTRLNSLTRSEELSPDLVRTAVSLVHTSPQQRTANSTKPLPFNPLAVSELIRRVAGFKAASQTVDLKTKKTPIKSRKWAVSRTTRLITYGLLSVVASFAIQYSITRFAKGSSSKTGSEYVDMPKLVWHHADTFQDFAPPKANWDNRLVSDTLPKSVCDKYHHVIHSMVDMAWNPKPFLEFSKEEYTPHTFLHSLLTLTRGKISLLNRFAKSCHARQVHEELGKLREKHLNLIDKARQRDFKDFDELSDHLQQERPWQPGAVDWLKTMTTELVKVDLVLLEEGESTYSFFKFFYPAFSVISLVDELVPKDAHECQELAGVIYVKNINKYEGVKGDVNLLLMPKRAEVTIESYQKDRLVFAGSFRHLLTRKPSEVCQVTIKKNGDSEAVMWRPTMDFKGF